MTPGAGGRRGGGGALVEKEVFDFLVDLEVHKAVRMQYPVSVLCLGADLPEATAAETWRDDLAEFAVRELRSTDVAAFLDRAVAVLLIGAETQHLPGIVARLSATVEALWGRRTSTSALTLSAGGGCYPQTATSAGELLRQAVDLMTQARAAGGNRTYLPS
jgi:hypothetical protein